MKNPYYEPAPKPPKEKDHDQAAFLAAEKYLASDPSVAEVAESKVRAAHEDLARDDVWERVKARLEKANPKGRAE